MDKNSIIYVAGHRGMVGSAIVRELKKKGYNNVIGFNSKEYDLRNQSQVQRLFLEHTPEYVFLAAAKVGGIQANNIYRGDFIYDNLMIATNVIHESKVSSVKKLMFLGSSCIYPKFADQPISEESLLSGNLEPTNEPYAIAKIAGLKMCESYRRQFNCDFISVMPTNLYGIGDNYDLENSHVLPALIHKFHKAKIESKPFVEIWGSGTPKREFLFADDLAEACVYIMNHYSDERPINIGTGQDVTIKELAVLIKDIVGYKGELSFDLSKPDGTPRKLLDVSRLHELGYTHRTSLINGIRLAYDDFLKNYER